MRLHLILPCVEPEIHRPPTKCPQAGCGSQQIQLHQVVSKPVRDLKYREVTAYRYRCVRCRHTFRVYPPGVSCAHASQRLQGLGVMLYMLGLSYGATALALEALGVYLSKERIYAAVQALAQRIPGLKRGAVLQQVRTPALGADLTSVKCQGAWLTLGLTVDATNGLVLTVDQLDAVDAAALEQWLTPIVAAVSAQVLVSDDADGFKRVADRLGLQQQVCKSHVLRNTETLVPHLIAAVASDPDGSLATIGVTPAQAATDLQRLLELVGTRQPDQGAEVYALYERYQWAAPPLPGQSQSLAYRLRLLFLDRSNLWPRLTRYRTWVGPQGQRLDGTNNACERGIGWWIKERYRTMRGYKRPQSALAVSRLLVWGGNQLGTGGAHLAQLIA